MDGMESMTTGDEMGMPEPDMAGMPGEAGPNPEPEDSPEDAVTTEAMMAEEAAAMAAPEPEPMPEEAMMAEEAAAMEASEPEPMPEEAMAMPDQGHLDPMVWEVDPNSIEVHPLAELLPMMTPSELTALTHSTECEGQQHAGVMFEEKLLDGRNRRLACLEARRPFRVQNFLGTRDQALLHVVSSNRCRRDLNKSQLAAVGSRLLPQLSPEIQAERARKISEARRKAGEAEMVELIPGSPDEAERKRLARAVAADMVGVSDRYVADAARLEREAPELFEAVWVGRKTVTAAMRELSETAESGIRGHVRSTRSRFARWMRRAEAEERIDILDAFDEVMDRLDATEQDTAGAP